MMVFPDDLLYSREHTWARVDGNLATIGITDYAQDKLGKYCISRCPHPILMLNRMSLSAQLNL